jgi:hypothetical protein
MLEVAAIVLLND